MLFSLQEPFSNSGVPLNSIDVKVTNGIFTLFMFIQTYISFTGK